MDEKPTFETDEITSAEQTYLKAIYMQTRTGQPTSTVALAEELNIRPASVTHMMQKLAENYPKLVSYRKHHGISLTAAGEKAALLIIRRHRLIEQFLYQILEYPLEAIHQEADILEHAVSPYFIDRIARLLQEPSYDPHGHPIPNENLILDTSRLLVLLSDLQPGDKGTVRQITDQNSVFLAYLQSIGLCPGTLLEVRQVNPVDSARQVFLNRTNQTHVLGKTMSDNIQVEIQPEAKQ